MPRPTKKAKPVHVVREFRSSPVVYGPLRSKSNDDVHDNPNYHPTILLTSEGTFVDEQYRPVDPKDVPEYVKVEAKKTNLSTEFKKKKSRALSMAEAMLGAGVQDTEPDPKERASRSGARARQAYA